MVGSIVRYVALYLSDTAQTEVKLNAVRSCHLPKMADFRVICCDSVVATLAQLAPNRWAVV